MKFFVSTIAALAGIAVAAPAPAETSAVASATQASDACVTSAVSAIGSISDQLSNLKSEADAFEATFLTDIGPLLQLQKDAVTLQKTIDSAADTIGSCGSFDQTQSTTLASPLLQLVPNINTTLTALVAKKPEFDKSILNIISASWLVNIDLKNLKTSTNDLLSALTGSVSSTYVAIVEQQGTQINSWFDNAIAVFSKNNVINWHS